MPRGEQDKGRSITRLYGRLLREAREKAQLSQAAAAEMLGLSQAALSRYEAGAAQPDWETFQKMGEAYGVRGSELAPRSQYPSAEIDPLLRRRFFIARNALIQGNDPEEAIARTFAQERSRPVVKGE